MGGPGAEIKLPNLPNVMKETAQYYNECGVAW